MEISEKKYPKVGVGTIVIKDGKLLMGKRVKKGGHGVGFWSVPGGWLEFNESFEDGARRECLEETGVEVTNPKFFYATNNILKDDGIHTITIFMRGEHFQGEPMVCEQDKFVEVGWYDINNLPSPLFLPVEILLKSGVKLI